MNHFLLHMRAAAAVFGKMKTGTAAKAQAFEVLVDWMYLFFIWIAFQRIANDYTQETDSDLMDMFKALPVSKMYKQRILKAKHTAYIIAIAQKENKLPPFKWKRKKTDLLLLAKHFKFGIAKNGSSKFEQYYFEATKTPDPWQVDHVLPLVKKLP